MTGWLTQGPKVAAFERRSPSATGVEHALAATSCTTALHLILAALGVGPGDEVIVPAFTWVATANVVDLLRRDAGVRRRRSAHASTSIPAQVRAARHAAHQGDHRRAPVRPVRRHRRDRARCRAGVPIVEDAACAAGARLQGPPGGLARRCAAASPSIRASRSPPAKAAWSPPTTPRWRSASNMLRNHGAERLRGAAPQRPAALPAAGLQPARLQLPDDRPAGRGRAGAARASSTASSTSASAGPTTTRASSPTSPWLRLPQVPRRLTPWLAGLRLRCGREPAPMPRNDDHGRGCRSGASARGPARTPCTCSATTASRFGLEPERFPGGP